MEKEKYGVMNVVLSQFPRVDRNIIFIKSYWHAFKLLVMKIMSFDVHISRHFFLLISPLSYYYYYFIKEFDYFYYLHE
jgi:hypothetical protein